MQTAATLSSPPSIPSRLRRSGGSGWRPLAQSRRTRSSVSSSARVVRSITVIACKSDGCDSFVTAMRAASDSAACSMESASTRVWLIHSASNGMPRLRLSALPGPGLLAMRSLPALDVIADQSERPVHEMNEFSVGCGDEQRRDHGQMQNEKTAQRGSGAEDQHEHTGERREPQRDPK